MAASSLSVVANASRLRRFTTPTTHDAAAAERVDGQLVDVRT
jgi:hypothetical protein